jgi:putative peptidoglycan lipid II flippase
VLLTLGLGSSTGLVMVAHLLLRRYGSGFGPGAISALGYAYRIYEVPVSLAANTAAVLVLPTAARLAAGGGAGEIARLCRNLILWGLILLLPAAIIAATLPSFLVELLLRRGRFSLDDAALTATALAGFAPAILFEAGFVVLYRIFYALQRPLVPVVISLATLAAEALLLRAAAGWGGFPLLPYLLSASFALTLALLVAMLRRQLGPAALPGPGALLRPIAIALAAAALWRRLQAPFDPVALAPSLVGAAGFALVFTGGVLAAMPRERAQLLGLIRPRGR